MVSKYLPVRYLLITKGKIVTLRYGYLGRQHLTKGPKVTPPIKGQINNWCLLRQWAEKDTASRLNVVCT